MDTAAIPSVPRRLILVATPIILVLIELAHPPMPTLAIANWWVAIHVIQLPLFGLFALALLLLLDGSRGVVATLTRVAVGVFLVFYTFLDSTAGIAAGIWLEGERGLTGPQRAGAEHVLAAFFADPVRQTLVGLGYAGLVVAMLGACVVLAGTQAVRVPLGLLLAGALLMVVAWGVDVPLIGPLRVLGPILGALGAAVALYQSGAPGIHPRSARWQLALPLALVVVSAALVALYGNDPYEAIGLTVGALGVAFAVALAVWPRLRVALGNQAAEGTWRVLPLVPLMFSATVLSVDHASPYGPVGFASFLLAALWLERGTRARARAEASLSSGVGVGLGASGTATSEPTA